MCTCAYLCVFSILNYLLIFNRHYQLDPHTILLSFFINKSCIVLIWVWVGRRLPARLHFPGLSCIYQISTKGMWAAEICAFPWYFLNFLSFLLFLPTACGGNWSSHILETEATRGGRQRWASHLSLGDLRKQEMLHKKHQTPIFLSSFIFRSLL